MNFPLASLAATQYQPARAVLPDYCGMLAPVQFLLLPRRQPLCPMWPRYGSFLRRPTRW